MREGRGEFSLLTQATDQPVSGNHCGEVGPGPGVAGEVIREGLDVPARQLGRATELAFGLVGKGHAYVHLGLERKITERVGDGERPLTEAECAIVIRGEKEVTAEIAENPREPPLVVEGLGQRLRRP
jgi:hypothetical protein